MQFCRQRQVNLPLPTAFLPVGPQSLFANLQSPGVPQYCGPNIHDKVDLGGSESGCEPQESIGREIPRALSAWNPKEFVQL